MNKHSKILTRVMSLFLTVLMVFSAFGSFTLSSNAAKANVTKEEKRYDIAVVFDNSGSMYAKGRTYWCQAKYAMEIFASMLNYDNGDKLKIFTMWNVTVDGKTFPKETEYNKTGTTQIEINNKDDIDKISNLFTIAAKTTPFEPVNEAHDYLKKSQADEKWLIVLADGDFTKRKRGDVEEKDQNGKTKFINWAPELAKLASNEIKIQYLGFGDAGELEASESTGLFVEGSYDSELKDRLINVCNYIFERDLLEGKLKDKKLTLDLSMKNLVVFVQGNGAKVNSLKDQSGKAITPSLDSGQRKFSEIKAGNGKEKDEKGNVIWSYKDALVDKTLYGQVVTFSNLKKGEYTLDCSGTDADSIQIFYEPDVDLKVSLLKDGKAVDASSGELAAGTYTVESKIVDNITGEDVTENKLLGDVDLKTYFRESADSDYVEVKNNEITVKKGTTVDIAVEGKYLEDYTITSKDSSDLSWLQNLKVTEEFKAEADVLQSQSWYQIKHHDEWKPIKVTLSLDGKPLNDEQLARTTIKINSEKELPYRCEMLNGESAYNIYIGQDADGKYVEPDTGKYKLDITATYKNEKGNSSPSSDEVSFEIQVYSIIWRWLFWIILIAVIITLWLTYMLQKVLPKDIRKDTASFNTISAGDLEASFVNVEYRRKGKSLTITGPSAVNFDEQCSASYSLRAVDNRFTKSRKRRIAVTGIDSSCDEMKVAGTPYVNYNGQWVKKNQLKAAEDGKPVAPIDQVLSCNPRFELTRSGGIATLKCKTKTTK